MYFNTIFKFISPFLILMLLSSILSTSLDITHLAGRIAIILTNVKMLTKYIALIMFNNCLFFINKIKFVALKMFKFLKLTTPPP